MSQPRFSQPTIRNWRRAVFREIKTLGFTPGYPGFSAAMVMAAVYGFGTDTGVLSEITGHGEEYIKTVLKRLRKTRILSGQTLRVRWDKEGFEGLVALACDALVASGNVERPPDPKRSAAQRGRTDGRGRGTPKVRSAARPSGAFTPKVVQANPLYQIAGKQEKPDGRNG